ncbi:hypothetical protein H112_07066 [Trichophyton rubrum D6]|uniref:Uncharacterized protein n=2 Tax=Trichophyton TaxID=5550 RepID=A0A022VTG0_TRIRU|nr:hypothetical protein H100_07089 [Trichophyton rubrum MR850]EZF38737.1 hypothetical protein H102_07051 [Trichophyton rubrum CBS 100081]EZF49370.1 hypothetical protein H103_07072 [Trichophyton rubrum CBS 288.86]EZF59982.1 hypothetical protein H104_07028 [Trichophyton rubrum CBS 289.86]EZF70634.1 hypothetical protein H105_07086 [Trichophyton soudanense CBS 452.61]EZF81299.1 hypothetical protein H110_07068 [Trichophyton rubrum MR1448]EZF91940.1 hypothetical protein H113_07123 [Trichophyton rub
MLYATLSFHVVAIQQPCGGGEAGKAAVTSAIQDGTKSLFAFPKRTSGGWQQILQGGWRAGERGEKRGSEGAQREASARRLGVKQLERSQRRRGKSGEEDGTYMEIKAEFIGPGDRRD